MKTGPSTAAALKTGEPLSVDEDDAAGSSAGKPLLSLVPDTLETLLTKAIVALRSSPDFSVSAPDFTHACRRDAIAAIEIGRALGLLDPAARHVTLCCAPCRPVLSSEVRSSAAAQRYPLGD
jgi:hypothetical protein